MHIRSSPHQADPEGGELLPCGTVVVCSSHELLGESETGEPDAIVEIAHGRGWLVARRGALSVLEVGAPRRRARYRSHDSTRVTRARGDDDDDDDARTHVVPHTADPRRATNLTAAAAATPSRRRAKRCDGPKEVEGAWWYRVTHPDGMAFLTQPAVDAARGAARLPKGATVKAVRKLTLPDALVTFAQLERGAGWVLEATHGGELLERFDGAPRRVRRRPASRGRAAVTPTNSGLVRRDTPTARRSRDVARGRARRDFTRPNLVEAVGAEWSRPHTRTSP